MHKFIETGSVKNVQIAVNACSCCSAENIDAVRKNFAEDTRISTPYRLLQLGIAKTTAWQVWKKDYLYTCIRFI